VISIAPAGLRRRHVGDIARFVPECRIVRLRPQTRADEIDHAHPGGLLVAQRCCSPAGAFSLPRFSRNFGLVRCCGRRPVVLVWKPTGERGHGQKANSPASKGGRIRINRAKDNRHCPAPRPRPLPGARTPSGRRADDRHDGEDDNSLRRPCCGRYCWTSAGRRAQSATRCAKHAAIGSDGS